MNAPGESVFERRRLSRVGWRRTLPTPVFTFALLLACAGCSGGNPPVGATDAASGDSAPPTDAGGPSTPAPPRPPALTPCPTGHRVVLPAYPGGPEHCDPWPEGGPWECAVDETHLPGEPGCSIVGDPCPADGIPAGLPSDAPVVYTRAGAVGGDGTRAAPFGTLADALAGAASGAIVAIGPGTYDARQGLDVPVTLWGACAGDVALTTDSVVGIILRSTGVSLRNLRFSDLPVAINMIAGELSIRGVIFSDVRDEALRVLEGTVEVDGAAFRSVGRGALIAHEGATAAVRRASIEGGESGALQILGASVSLEDPAIRRNEPGAISTTIFLTGASDLRLERVALHGNRSNALMSLGGEVRLVDVTMEGPPASVAVDQQSIVALDGATVQLDRTRLERGRGVALGSLLGGQLALRDVLVRDVLPDGGGEGGHALEITEGGRATLERVVLERTRWLGLLVSDDASTLDATDLSIDDTRSSADGQFGRAIHVQEGGALTAARIEVRRSREAAVAGFGTATVLDLLDAAIADTLPRECVAIGCPGAGIGLGSYLGAMVTAERFAVTGSALSGVQVSRDGEMDLRDGLIAHNPVGANVPIPDYDLSRLTDTVTYRDNGVNLDATTLPTPSADAPLVSP